MNAVGAVEAVELISWDMRNPAPRSHIDVVVPPYMGSPWLLRELKGISTRLVQSQSIGFDGVREELPSGHVFANASGVHESSTAELALALMLASQRGLPDFYRSAASQVWRPEHRPSLADRRVVLIGYGGVGRAIADRLRGFEVDLVRVASVSRRDEHGEIFSFTRLPSLLSDAEIVVACVPLTTSTYRLIDDQFLSALPDDALVVNVSRGQVADTSAIAAHASIGRLRFALDVTDPEPLPDGHPLWSLPNVLITPHVGGASSAMLPRMVALLLRQVAALKSGNELENVVLRT